MAKTQAPQGRCACVVFPRIRLKTRQFVMSADHQGDGLQNTPMFIFTYLNFKNTDMLVLYINIIDVHSYTFNYIQEAPCQVQQTLSAFLCQCCQAPP